MPDDVKVFEVGFGEKPFTKSFSLTSFIGKPYVANGRGPAGYDCWGLVLAVARSAGLEYPEFVIDARDCRAVAGVMQRACADSATWLRLTDPEPWCVVLLTTERHGDHVGIAMGAPVSSPGLSSRPTHFLQTTLRTGCILSSFHDPRFKNRIKGLYRWNR